MHCARKFIVPPRSLELEYAFDFHLENNPNYPVFTHSSGNADGALRYYTYSEVVPAIHRAGRLISQSIGFNANPNSESAAPVVAILAEMSKVN